MPMTAGRMLRASRLMEHPPDRFRWSVRELTTGATAALRPAHDPHGPVAVTALLPAQQRVAHHPDRMDHPAARPLLDLDLAGAAPGRHHPDTGLLDAVEQGPAHPHRQIEVLLLHAEGAGDPAAVILADRHHFDLRNETEQPDHRLPHPPRLEMTWVVVGEAHGYRTQAGARRPVGVAEFQGIVAEPTPVARHDVRP